MGNGVRKIRIPIPDSKEDRERRYRSIGIHRRSVATRLRDMLEEYQNDPMSTLSLRDISDYQKTMFDRIFQGGTFHETIAGPDRPYSLERRGSRRTDDVYDTLFNEYNIDQLEKGAIPTGTVDHSKAYDAVCRIRDKLKSEGILKNGCFEF